MTYDTQDTPKETRTGVNIVKIGKQRFAVATIRQGNSLVFLGKGTLDYCVALYDAAKKEQEKQLIQLRRIQKAEYEANKKREYAKLPSFKHN